VRRLRCRRNEYGLRGVPRPAVVGWRNEPTSGVLEPYALGGTPGVVGFAPLEARGTGKLFERLRIITLGAVVELPAAFQNVKQFLGALARIQASASHMSACRGQGISILASFNHMSAASLLNGDVALRLLPKPPIAEAYASLSIPPIAVTEPVPMPAVKAKDAVRKPPKKEAKPPSVAPKMPSADPR
jgi:hypothetical protein